MRSMHGAMYASGGSNDMQARDLILLYSVIDTYVHISAWTDLCVVRVANGWLYWKLLLVSVSYDLIVTHYRSICAFPASFKVNAPPRDISSFTFLVHHKWYRIRLLCAAISFPIPPRAFLWWIAFMIAIFPLMLYLKQHYLIMATMILSISASILYHFLGK